jgi:UDP-N-acetylglucosamine transferase subunit ALG13
MIFVTLGTEQHPFDRLLSALDKLQAEMCLHTRVVVQGYAPRKYPNLEHRELIPFAEWNELIGKADIVITHGGPGCILMTLHAGKVPIVVPRQSAFAEHVDDHQVEFAEFLAAQQSVLAVFEIGDLGRVLRDYETLTRGLGQRESDDIGRVCVRFGSLVERLVESE